MGAVRGKTLLLGVYIASLLASITIPSTSAVTQKTFTYKAANASEITLSFPRTKYGDCVFDQLRHVTTCTRNYPYDVITTTWRSAPENITYVAVNCLQQRLYEANHQQCVCKDRTMAASVHRGTQMDSYSFCQLDNVYHYMLQPLINLEVLDLSHNHLFRVCPDCFNGLKNLKVISLSNNPINSLFDGVLCDVPSLEVLVLQDLPMTYFPRNAFKCEEDFMSTLKIIDMSHSKVSSIQINDFDHLSNLELLDLSYNEILEIPERPFKNLDSIVSLDLSGNHFRTLPQRFCNYIPHLKRLIIRDHSLESFNCQVLEPCSGLDSVVFSGGSISAFQNTPCHLNVLKHIDLSRNRLITIPNQLLLNDSVIEFFDLSQNSLRDIDIESFHNMINLRFLNLSYNDFTKIDQRFQKASQHLTKLHVLDFHDNDIENVKDGSFIHLMSLKSLNLSRNHLTSVHAHTFAGLDSIEKLSLDNNNVSDIADESFALMSRLSYLDLSYNELTKLNIELPFTLTVLNLQQNKVDKLRLENRMYNLDIFNLRGNRLSVLSSVDFKDMVNLRILDLSQNLLSSLEDTFFSYLSNLEDLNLSGNALTLDLSTNIFAQSNRLKRLDLSHNRISSVISMFSEGHLSMLTNMDLSFNQISFINSSLNPQETNVALKWINLQSCGIKSISKTAFEHLDALEYVNLQHNLITHVPLFEARIGARFYLKENPVTCDCSLTWILDLWLDRNGTTVKMSTHDYDIDVCRVYPSMVTKTAKKLTKSDYLCPQAELCPEECTCFVLEEDSEIYSTVCSQSLTTIPAMLPNISQLIYLDGNNFGVLSMISAERLDAGKLFLNASGISKINANVFRNLKQLVSIDLSKNHLDHVPSSLLDGLQYLKDINLSNNKLVEIPSGLFRNTPSLQNIDLSYNKLHVVSPDTLAEFDNLDMFRWIRLAGNPLTCACPNYEFRHWMEKSYSRIYDKRRVTCDDGEELRRSDIHEFDCPNNFPLSLKTAIILISISVVIFPVAVFLVYCRREVIAVCYTRVLPLFMRQKKNRHHVLPYMYDGVVLYDTTDPKCCWWVQKSLVPKLTEGRRKYRLYIPKSQTESRDTTVFNIKKSRCTIALVTNTFAQNRFAMECFRHSVTQEINNDNDHHVIIVTWGFIDKKNLPHSLKHFVEHTPVLPVTTTFFWDKLILRLPNTLTSMVLQDTGHDNRAAQYDENRF